MCGIAALLEPSAPEWLPEAMRRMIRLVRHRGPDGEGFTFFYPDRPAVNVLSDESPAGVSGERTPPPGATLALGHRRLAILDLSAAGHQPMSDPSQLVWVTFNGEIYNYVELRALLEPLGYRFATGTDTEVILAAWLAWGEACLTRFNGMFAFVLVDLRTQRVFAARDRFGVKPLYVWRTPGGGIAFASEIKQFTAHPQWRPRVNGQRAYDFINWGISDHTRETMFAGVEQLRGGEYLLASLPQLPRATPVRWYELCAPAFAGNEQDAASRFRELFDDSVRLRLRADVPVGSCLSGGLDSSSIVCTIRAQLGAGAAAQQNTFSAYSDVARFDERRHVQDVVRTTGVRGRHVVPQPEALLRELDAVAWHQDEPFGSTSIYAQWCVFRAAREQGVAVMLDGQGADEALAGYHGFFAPRIAALCRQGHWREGWREAAAVRSLHGQSWPLQAGLLANEFFFGAFGDWLRALAGRTVRMPAFLDLDKLRAAPGSPLAAKIDRHDPVRSLSRAQLMAINLPMLLRFEDRDSMAHGVEARLPFLDYRLVEFCLGLPDAYKIADGWTKRVLRESMHGRIPDSVRLRRDKLGFATAEEEWMRGPKREAFLQLVRDAVAASDGIFTPAMQAHAEGMIAGRKRFSFLVWRCISFGAWLKCFAPSAP